MVDSARAGDFARARELHYRLLPLFDVLFCETNPIPVKTAVAMQGQCDPGLRLPLTAMTDANRERLQLVMKELGLL
jgi:4-hydroxy-tetrahydrodipicolinate synthase